ncbi:MAG: ribosomal protein S18-alanine N-acetyltransferase [Chloroflexi bacterium]|nr:ribosomal protein S18-alanine N-acetyltransferase [Chloroflexota bacterium]
MENSITSLKDLALTFDRMTLEDIPLVSAIEQRCFSAPWSAHTYRHELLHNQRSFYWVLRSGLSHDRNELPPILAYVGYWLLDHEAHIMTIATHPEWQRHKLGEWLLLEMLSVARIHGAQQAILEVRVGNRAAINLYTKLGFVEVGLRKRYYRDNGEDALLLTLFHLDKAAIWDLLAQRLATLRLLF